MDFKKYLSNDERDSLESMLRARLEHDTRNCLLILVALYSGARASELLSIEWTDLDLNSGALFLRTAKGGKPRNVALPRYLLRPLARLREISPRKPFALSYNRLGEVWRLYRQCDKPFHCLRHTFAMWLYDKTKDIRFVQYAMGHRSIQNTMVYAEYSYSVAEFRKLARVR